MICVLIGIRVLFVIRPGGDGRLSIKWKIKNYISANYNLKKTKK